MTLQRNRRRRAKLITATGVVMALVAAVTVFALLQTDRAPATTAEVPMREVVIAARDIALRTPITSDDVTVREVPADDTNLSAVQSADEVIDRVTAVAVPAGQLITANLLIDQTGSPIEGGSFDPDGPHQRAVSVQVPLDRAVGGVIQTGQHVDLIASLPIESTIIPVAEEGVEAPPPTVLSGPSTKVTLQNLTVIAREGPDIYILDADLSMAEEIAELIAAGGTFTLVLRPDGDTRAADTAGSTLDRLLEKYDFPIPEPAVSTEDGSSPATIATP